MTAGDLPGAAARYEAQARRYRDNGPHAVSLFSLALVTLRQGDLDRAASLYSSADRHRLARRSGPRAVKAAIALQLGLVYALKGDLTAADAWVAEYAVRRRRSEPGALLLNTSIIGCRRG